VRKHKYKNCAVAGNCRLVLMLNMRTFFWCHLKNRMKLIVNIVKVRTREVDCKYSESKNTCPLPSKVRSLARHIEPLNRVSSRGKEFTPDISATLFFSASAVQ